MRAVTSIRGGVCVFEDDRQGRFVNIADLTLADPAIAHLCYGAVEDWEVVIANDRKSLLEELDTRYKIMRAAENVEICLLGISAGLQKELLLEVEEMLTGQKCLDGMVSWLMRAPLASVDGVAGLVKTCLAEGLGVTAAALEEVREEQPLLRRFSDRWLSLPEDCFVDFMGGRQRVWRMGVNLGIVRQSLIAKSYHTLEHEWGQLAFLLSSPIERSKIGAISKAIASAIFPQGGGQHVLTFDPNETFEEKKETTATTDYVLYQRALKQVRTIVDEVSRGNDTKARQFMHGVVRDQLSEDQGEKNAVKTLCNIAKQCAALFRTDFELECLELAVKTNPNDGWTKVQLADHFKRVGRFSDAITTLEIASQLGEVNVARSSIADVYVHMGEFEKALETYEQISGSESDSTIRGAKADVLRFMGRFDEAKLEYERIINEGLPSNRARAGLAEIAKRTGELEHARDLYEDLVEREEEEESLMVYRSALANVLVRLGDLKSAYEHLDTVVDACPFSLRARASRAAVVGLLGDPSKGLRDLPNIGTVHAFNEWVKDYVRGLLLLQLDRHQDACAALIRNVKAAFSDRTGEAMLRLGAAACLLSHRSGIEAAAKILDDFPKMSDSFADAIVAAFQYHVAIALRRENEIARLEKQLAIVRDADLQNLVSAIAAKDWDEVLKLEVRALLRLQLAA